MTDLIRQPRVLVVDDDARSRRLLRGLLEPVGSAVTEAAGGAEALPLLEAGAWDLVLLDLSMPGMDGFEVLERIRARWPMEELPVILVTGMDDADARLRGLQLRANEFLAKPVDQAELLARVGAQLAYRFARVELQERVRELEAARAFRDFLADTMLRELRSPMTTIMGNLDLARLEPDGSPRTRRLIDASLQAAAGAAALAADTADLLGATEGRIRPHPAPVSLVECLRGALEAAAPDAAARTVRIVHTEGPRLPAVRADARLAGRALGCLLKLAVREAAAGEWLEAGVGPGPDGRVAVVTLRAAGAEFGAAVRRELGRRSDQPVAGASIAGLALARVLLEAMGGRLAAAPAAGGGSEVLVTLPVDQLGGDRESVAAFAPGVNPV